MDDLQLTRYISHPLLHIIQSIAEGTDIHSVKSHAVVINPDQKNFINFYIDDYMKGICVFHNIMECFFYCEINIAAKFTAYKNGGKNGRRIHLALDTIIQEIFNSINARIG